MHEMMGLRVSCALALAVLLTILGLACVSSAKSGCPPKVRPSPAGVPVVQAKCPKDTLKFGVCGSWLGLINEQIGAKPSKKCCSLLTGLADLEAALCLCTALKANVLGVVNLDVPIALSLLVNSCGKSIPQGFVCP
ncbi:putative lipid-binding protein At4g00165 [Momordica charantia]|uniref:Lipid-binding protein At4g00165 n=1 Tax=Momordica charantia TaxID=3673 RepID=A0A6J1DWJ4_MOMCH|nr:putative lipid-binding protein At4g00165 [Momordica charantia]